jgi:hypothetical protein
MRYGCNAPGGDEPCALSVFGRAAADDTDAATAVTRWEEWQEACQPAHSEGERRFRRRAFQRARDQALIALALGRPRLRRQVRAGARGLGSGSRRRTAL